MGKRIAKNIEENIVNRAMEEEDYELFVLNETQKYSNQKRTGEILAYVASKIEKKFSQADSLKEDFIQSAINFSNRFNEKTLYEDPDKASVQLYKFWGDFLKSKGIIQKYEIIYKYYWFRLKVEFENKIEILGSDGIISVNLLRKESNIVDYKKIGGFMIWPSHRGGINFKKNRFRDRLDKTMDEIEKYYNKSDLSNFISQNDKVWFDHVGKFYKEMSHFESFCKCFELDLFLVSDTDEYYNCLLDNIDKRSQAMWKILGSNMTESV